MNYKEWKHDRESLDRQQAASWAAWLRGNERQEYLRVLHGREPTDYLIALADTKVTYKSGNDGFERLNLFPGGLNTRKGKELLYQVVLRQEQMTQFIPEQAYAKWLAIDAVCKGRRKDTQANIRAIAECNLHRAANEGKLEVINRYVSIIDWVTVAYGKTLQIQQISKALGILHDTKYFRVMKAKPNMGGWSTRVHTGLDARELAHTGEAREWMDHRAGALERVYRNEGR